MQFLGYFMFMELQLRRKLNFGKDWLRTHGVIVQTNFRQNSIFCYQRKFSLLTEDKMFIHIFRKGSKYLMKYLSELNHDTLYFLLFVCFYKSFGLKWLIVVFSAVLDMILIFIWRVSISFRMSKVKGNRLRNHGDISFQRGRMIKSNFQINGWLQTCDHDLLRSL